MDLKRHASKRRIAESLPIQSHRSVQRLSTTHAPRAPSREIDVVAVSHRDRAPSYDEIYGTRRSSPAAPAKAQKPRRHFPVGLLAVLTIGVLAGGAVSSRARVVAAVPALAPGFAAVGLPVNLRGLEIRNVKATIFDDGSRKTLGVEGEIINLRPGLSHVPDLRFGLRGADGREVYAWTSSAQVSEIDKGGAVLFRARLASPPEEAHDVLVRFIGGDGQSQAALRGVK
jgi:hypothetical protein